MGSEGVFKEVELSKRFVGLTEELLGEEIFAPSPMFPTAMFATAYMPKAMGMSFRVPERAMTPAYYPPEVLHDLASIATSLSSGKTVLAKQFEEIKKEAEGIIDESSLVSRYADYQDAIVGMSTATEMIKDVSEKIDAEVDHGREGGSERIKDFLGRVGEVVASAFKRVFDVVAKGYNGLMEFSSQLKELIENVGRSAKEEIIAGLHRIVQMLSSLSVRIISTFFAWLSSIKKIASDRGFTMNEVNVKLNPITIEKVTVLGSSIPIPKISMPEVSIKFV